ncbi:MAG: quinolinate synthase NadA [Spirochaetales bacterium]|nr:quinolinate synthase NadA [Spirochaetales bacterium]
MQTADQLFETLSRLRFGVDEENLRAYVEGVMPLVEEIQDLKREKNAIILAHTYVPPIILYSVADKVGDSYGLSKDALAATEDTIVFSAVRFMGETAKILNPGKSVLIPGTDAGCTLADSITADEVRALRRQHPEHVFVCYINTTAAVKAECDVCVTSSNVYDIIERIESDKILFLPDRLMGANIIAEMAERGVQKEILLTDGSCYVHEEFDPNLIPSLRESYPDLYVMAHPECRPEVVSQADYAGSTTQMFRAIASMEENRNYLMLTECGLVSRIEAEMPGRNFVGTCQLCKYMKSNSLEGIRRVLTSPREEDFVQIDPSVLEGARSCVDAMFRYAE